MTNEEAIKQLEITKQCDVDTVAQIKALNMAIVALRNYPISEPLTLEQLREMDGQPAWCEEQKEWGIIHIDPDGMWANIPFFRGVYCDLDVKHNGLTLYAYQPAHIDREGWECPICNSYEVISFKAWKKPEQVIGGPFAQGCAMFCPHCGKPRTPEAWAELEKRMGVR